METNRYNGVAKYAVVPEYEDNLWMDCGRETYDTIEEAEAEADKANANPDNAGRIKYRILWVWTPASLPFRLDHIPQGKFSPNPDSDGGVDPSVVFRKKSNEMLTPLDLDFEVVCPTCDSPFALGEQVTRFKPSGVERGTWAFRKAVAFYESSHPDATVSLSVGGSVSVWEDKSEDPEDHGTTPDYQFTNQKAAIPFLRGVQK